MVLVCRTAYHVGVGIVVDSLHTLFFRLAPLLGSLYAAAKHSAHLLHDGAVGFGTLDFVLANGIVGRVHILAVGFLIHLSCVQVLFGLLDTVAQCLFF